jgi:hypothetical protein
MSVYKIYVKNRIISCKIICDTFHVPGAVVLIVTVASTGPVSSCLPRFSTKLAFIMDIKLAGTQCDDLEFLSKYVETNHPIFFSIFKEHCGIYVPLGI